MWACLYEQSKRKTFYGFSLGKALPTEAYKKSSTRSIGKHQLVRSISIKDINVDNLFN
jgi:hypothetical protein